MTPSVGQCDWTLLRKLLDGSLSASEEGAVISHLDACDPCRRELEQISGDAASWQELQASLADGLTGPFPGRDKTGKDVDSKSCPVTSAAFSFLAPSDDPRMLGRIGLYEIAGLIGRGSTGIVFKAYEPSLHRYVAIKVLAPELAPSAAARKRFAREARAAAAVTHEHIVPIHAVSEFQGLPYIVMQYVAGHSLQDRIDQHGPLGIVEAVRIALQTAQALAAAHQQGLVHRDIKPGNILLTAGIENALVTDFGLARAADDASLTHSGLISGTPQYMSPEQARGETAGPQSDLFSLGSVIYTMCTGHAPFRAETMFGVIRRVCDATHRPMREVNAEAPEWLDQFTARLHAQAPDQRFHDAAEVVSLLESELAYLQNPSAIPVPKRSWMSVRLPWSRGRRKNVAACVAAALLAVGAAVSIVTAPEQQTTMFPTGPSGGAESAAESAQSKRWNGATVRYVASDDVVIDIAQDAESFQLIAAGPRTFHELALRDNGAGTSQLQIVSSMSQAARATREEFMDELKLRQVFVRSAQDTFVVTAKGSPPRDGGSQSSSTHSATSAADGLSRTSREDLQRPAEATEYTLAYGTMPSMANPENSLAVLCRVDGPQDATLTCDEQAGRLTLTITAIDGQAKHAIVLTSQGNLDVDGKVRRIVSREVFVAVRRQEFTIAVDDEEILSTQE